MNKQTYEIFARIHRGDDLMQIGTVEAQSDDLAIAYAAYIYNEEEWTDMIAVRRDHILKVRQAEPLFSKERMSV
ncbi:hypothetical protein [Ferviditalea candida]|uniref:Phenylacetic acid degradation B n=1 Tax=Ferviditalea candida TaxID=3108399 RepID=A0ABU5ZD63_9BACL|nr:hypothetical protein [Paenibacillaceae bacterium T2]